MEKPFLFRAEATKKSPRGWKLALEMQPVFPENSHLTPPFQGPSMSIYPQGVLRNGKSGYSECLLPEALCCPPSAKLSLLWAESCDRWRPRQCLCLQARLRLARRAVSAPFLPLCWILSSVSLLFGPLRSSLPLYSSAIWAQTTPSQASPATSCAQQSQPGVLRWGHPGAQNPSLPAVPLGFT